MKECVLRIYYKENGILKHEPQGKFFYLNSKETFLADLTPNKLWRNFNGYSIAKQILEAFSKAHIRPQIIYRRKDLGTLYYATPSLFIKKGILMSFGGHQQYILPIKNFIARPGDILGEPHDLPVMDIDDWLKTELTPTTRESIPIELFAANKLSGGFFA